MVFFSNTNNCKINLIGITGPINVTVEAGRTVENYRNQKMNLYGFS